MNNIAVCTTFPNHAWPIYAQRMIESYVKYWPAEVPLLAQLDDDLLYDQVIKTLRPQDAVAVGWEKDHREFVERNKDKDHPTDYRKMAVRFCHKVFALKRALNAVENSKKEQLPNIPRYLIWIDTDVLTTRQVSLDDIKECLPKEGDAVAYLGRKDWDHSECSWLAFDLENGGDFLIGLVCDQYLTNSIFKKTQWHDSWIWDLCFKDFTFPNSGRSVTNLTKDKPGTEIWEQSPMAKWSVHHKGPVAKQKLAMEPVKQAQPQANKVIVQTRNAIPHEQICAHVEKNQALIKNWISYCEPTDEEIVVVSAGPMLVAEDVRVEVEAGRKIVAVKHALKPLKAAGITPWACILLDPRPHVIDFIQDADPSIIWFVASQVNQQVTLELLAKGCNVWGYHASVGAGEHVLTVKQQTAIVSGGSATATRGLFMLHHLGFSHMRLYGYDLCLPDKPHLEAKDELGQPKFLEISLGMNDPLYNVKRCFWSSPELIAQFEEISHITKEQKFKLQAFGDGVVPFILKSQRVSNLRNKELKAKLVGVNPPTYKDLLDGSAAAAGRRATGN